MAKYDTKRQISVACYCLRNSHHQHLTRTF